MLMKFLRYTINIKTQVVLRCFLLLFPACLILFLLAPLVAEMLTSLLSHGVTNGSTVRCCRESYLYWVWLFFLKKKSSIVILTVKGKTRRCGRPSHLHDRRCLCQETHKKKQTSNPTNTHRLPRPYSGFDKPRQNANLRKRLWTYVLGTTKTI